MELLLRPWKRYSDSTGRATRSEYLIFFGIKYISVLLPFALDSYLNRGRVVMSVNDFNGYGVFALIVWLLVSLVPSVTLTARRLHDFNASGKWCITTFIPIFYVYLIAGIVIGLIPGTKGENDKGYDPREIRVDQVSAVFD